MAEANGSGGSGAVVRPRVFLDAQIGTEPVGRIVIELFVDKVPKTCENFKALCTTQQSDLSYKLSVFHRVIDEFMIQGGDITKGDGTGGKSIYGEEFEDENLGWHDLDKAGLVCMANRGKDTNNSQFFLSLAPCPHLNGKHTVFGLVVSGQPVLERIAKVKVDKNDRPLDDVLVAHCGELERRKKAAPAAANGRDGHADPTLRDVEKDDKKDERGRKRRRLNTGRDATDSSSPSPSTLEAHHTKHDSPAHDRHGHDRRHRHHHRRRHDRSISHDSTRRGRSRTQLRSASRSGSPKVPPRKGGRSRSPARRDHNRHQEHGYRRYRSRSRSRSLSNNRHRYRRHRSPIFARQDEELIRREEQEREFEAGADRFEGVIEEENGDDEMNFRPRGDGGRRFPDGGGRYGKYGRSDGRLGGGAGFGDAEDDEGGVKFKGRGSMKYQEKRR